MPTLELPPDLAARLAAEVDPAAPKRVLDDARARLTPIVTFKEEVVGKPPASRGFFDWLRGRPPPPPPEPVLRPEQTKMGGIPYLEDAGQWPRDPEGRLLAFDAQINFAELPAVDSLPRRGILSVFSLRSSPDWDAFVWTPGPTLRAVPPPAEAPRSPFVETRLDPVPRAMVEDRLEFSTLLGREVPDDLEAELSGWTTEVSGPPSTIQLLGTIGWTFDEVRASARRRARSLRPAAERGRPFVHAAPTFYDFVSPEGIPREELDAWTMLLRIGGDSGDTALMLLLRKEDLAAGQLDTCVACTWREG